MTEKTFVHILDSSLRDGSHALSHQYTAAQVSSVARGLDDAGVEMIEVSHGDGLGGSTITYGFSKQSEMELLQAASEVIKKGKLAVLLLPGIGTKDDLKMAADYGAKSGADRHSRHRGRYRRAAHRRGKKNGHGSDRHAHAVTHGITRRKSPNKGNSWKVSAPTWSWLPTPPARSCPIRLSSGSRHCAQRSRSASAFTVTIISPSRSPTALRRLRKARAGSTLALAVWAPARATRRPKCSPRCLDKMGYETGINLWKIMDVAENVVRPIMPKPVRIGKVSLTMGYAGVYSSFLLHADKAAEAVRRRCARYSSGTRQTQGRRRTRRYDRRSGDDAGGKAETRRESLGHTHFSIDIN